MTGSPDVAHLAEQAVLGAALAQGHPPAGRLDALDFADPVHQAICAAIATELRSRGHWNRLLDRVAYFRSRQARDSRPYLEELLALSHELRHGTSYAAMIATTAAQRTAAAQSRQDTPSARRATPSAVEPAQKLAIAAGFLAAQVAGERQKATGAAVSNDASAVLPALDPQVARLARALRPVVRSMSRKATVTARRGGVGEARTGNTAIEADIDGDRLQEQLLTTLLRSPGEVKVIVGTLPEAAFSAGPRRELWQMISRHVLDSRPFDPLILAWAASRNDARRQPDGGESLAAMTLRLAASDAIPGTAGLLARVLSAGVPCDTRLSG